MRKRNRSVRIRLSDREYEIFQKKLKESGLTQTAFIVAAIQNTAVQPYFEYQELEKTNAMLWGLCNQFRKVGVNINQITRYINTTHNINPEIEKALIESLKMLAAQKEMTLESWQYIKQLIQKGHRRTVR